MIAVTIVAVAVACGFAVVAWAQRREAQQRSAARVAALAAAIDEPFDADRGQEPFSGAGLTTRGYTLESFASEGPVFAPLRRGWIVAAGAVPLVLVVAALLVTRGPRPAQAPAAARQPQLLELLDMHHDRHGDRLTVTGSVRMRGRDATPVTAVVTGRDAAGRIVASAHAPLDDAALDIDGESSFQVSVSGGSDVRRYQVRFETPLGPLAHVDSRPQRP